jgi:hypothetical protein
MPAVGHRLSLVLAKNSAPKQTIQTVLPETSDDIFFCNFPTHQIAVKSTYLVRDWRLTFWPKIGRFDCKFFWNFLDFWRNFGIMLTYLTSR